MLGIQQVIPTLIVHLQVRDVCGVDGASRLRVEEEGGGTLIPSFCHKQLAEWEDLHWYM